MESEGRLLHKDWSQYNGATVVFKPKLMTEETLQRGFNWVCQEAYSWNFIVKRVFHPQQRFYTRVLSNMAYRSIVKRTPKSSIPALSKILQKMNDTIPVHNTWNLIYRVGEKMVEKGLTLGGKSPEVLRVYSTYNERLRTLFIHLEGCLDQHGAKELAKRLKNTISEKIDQVIIDFENVVAFSQDAISFLSHRGLLQKEEGKLWMAINTPPIV